MAIVRDMRQAPGGWQDLSAAEAVRPSSAVPADTSDLDIRMSPLHFLFAYLAGVGVAALGSAGLIFRLQLAEHPENAGQALRAFLWLVIPMFALVTIYALRIRVRVRGDEVTHFGWRGTTRFPAHTADRAFKYGFEQMRGSQFRLFVVRDTSGRCAMSLFGMAWKDSDLDRLTARLGLQQVGWEQDSSYFGARKDCPAGGLPIFVQHPVTWTIICIPIALALAAITIAVFVR